MLFSFHINNVILLRDFIHYREPKFLGHKISTLSLVADVHSIHIVIIMVETVKGDTLIKVDRLGLGLFSDI